MDRLTGVVLDRIGSHVTVLTPKGEFKRVKITGRLPEIGEEIRIPVAHRHFLNLSRARWAAIAAAVILLMVAAPLLTMMNQPEVAMASVWVENPGIELTVSRGNDVMDVRTTNAEGEKVLTRLGDIKGSSYYNAVAEITRESMKLGYIHSSKDLLISYVLMSDSGVDKESLESTLTASVNSILADDKIEVAAIQVPSDVREKASKKGLTSAKYAVLVEAVNAGLPVTEKDIQEKGIEGAISSAGGQPEQIIAQASKEDQFAEKERKYLAIASRNPSEPTGSVSIAVSDSGGQPVLSGTAPDNTAKPDKPRKLIEPIRRTGDPEDSRSDSGSGATAPKPAVAAQTPASPADGSNQASAASPGTPADNTGTNTDDNYMGPAQPDNGDGNSNDNMYKVKPNF